MEFLRGFQVALADLELPMLTLPTFPGLEFEACTVPGYSVLSLIGKHSAMSLQSGTVGEGHSVSDGDPEF